jgi:hypothetical protein
MKAIKSTSVSDDEVRVLLDRYKCPSGSDAVPRKYRFPSNVSITAAKTLKRANSSSGYAYLQRAYFWRPIALKRAVGLSGPSTGSAPPPTTR